MTREEQIRKWADDLVAHRITPECIPRGHDREQVQLELLRRSELRRLARATEKKKGRT